MSGLAMSETIAGRVWLFGDHINTDLMLPGNVRHASVEVQARNVFVANRPGWVDQVRAGDFIVAGQNFGTGSSRPAARSLRIAGIACVVAETINSLFFRNAVNYGLLALECPGVAAAFTEGQTAEFAFADFTVRNRETGAVLQALSIPRKLLDIMVGGGLLPVLEARGLIAPELPKETAP
jgi:3-isopropylmalate/(R)-2-methylmalate dehydratase small subunit